MYLESCAELSTVYSAQACRTYLNESSVGPNHVWHGHNWSWPVRVQRELRKVHAAQDWNELHHLLIMESLGGNTQWYVRNSNSERYPLHILANIVTVSHGLNSAAQV